MEAIKLRQHNQHMENLCKSGQTDSLSLCTNQAQVTSLAEIVKEDYPLSIIRAKNEQGVETLAAHIVSKINYYLNAVDLKHSMNEAQVLLCAKFIIEEYPHLPLKAMDLFFDDAIKGKFGHHYNKMDIPTLMSWLKKFENIYFDMVEEQAYVSHQSTKGDNVNYVDIYEKHKSECIEDEPVPMPDSFAKKHLKHEQQKMRERIKYKLMQEHYANIRESLKLQGYEGIELFNETDKLLELMVSNEIKKQ